MTRADTACDSISIIARLHEPIPAPHESILALVCTHISPGEHLYCLEWRHLRHHDMLTCFKKCPSPCYLAYWSSTSYLPSGIKALGQVRTHWADMPSIASVVMYLSLYNTYINRHHDIHNKSWFLSNLIVYLGSLLCKNINPAQIALMTNQS